MRWSGDAHAHFFLITHNSSFCFVFVDMLEQWTFRWDGNNGCRKKTKWRKKKHDDDHIKMIPDKAYGKFTIVLCTSNGVPLSLTINDKQSWLSGRTETETSNVISFVWWWVSSLSLYRPLAFGFVSNVSAWSTLYLQHVKDLESLDFGVWGYGDGHTRVWSCNQTYLSAVGFGFILLRVLCLCVIWCP